MVERKAADYRGSSAVLVPKLHVGTRTRARRPRNRDAGLAVPTALPHFGPASVRQRLSGFNWSVAPPGLGGVSIIESGGFASLHHRLCNPSDLRALECDEDNDDDDDHSDEKKADELNHRV